jgi:hypothetical protein
MSTIMPKPAKAHYAFHAALTQDPADDSIGSQETAEDMSDNQQSLEDIDSKESSNLDGGTLSQKRKEPEHPPLPPSQVKRAAVARTPGHRFPVPNAHDFSPVKAPRVRSSPTANAINGLMDTVSAISERLAPPPAFVDPGPSKPNFAELQATPVRKGQAMERLQDIDGDIPEQDMLDLLDIFNKDVATADTYNRIKSDKLRRGWIERKLNEHRGIDGFGPYM